VAHLRQVVLRQHCTSVIMVGFGTPEQVEPILAALHDEYQAAGLRVYEVLRVHERRYWSYLCLNPACCPPEGSPYDPTTATMAAEWTLAGRVARRNREEYEAQLAPVSGADRDAMVRATDRAHERLVDVLTSAADEATAVRTMEVEGRAALAAAAERVGTGAALTDDEVAWLSVLLVDPAVRDLAWLGVTDSAEDHRALWMDVLRRCEPDLSVAPATLFGFAAWRDGDGGMARLALERALAVDPDCELARELLAALARGMPPSALDSIAADLLLTRPPGQPRRKRSSRRRAGSRQA
jgi:hypothetical protein